jgi:hypothetical protein
LLKSITIIELNEIKKGSVVVIGFQYLKTQDSFNCTAATEFCKAINQCTFGAIINFEYGIDLSTLNLFYIDDIPLGASFAESLMNLSELVSEIVALGAIPFVIGGSNNQLCYTANGFAKSFEDPVIGVVNVNANLDTSLLSYNGDDAEDKLRLGFKSRYAQFAAQVFLFTIIANKSFYLLIFFY